MGPLSRIVCGWTSLSVALRTAGRRRLVLAVPASLIVTMCVAFPGAPLADLAGKAAAAAPPTSSIVGWGTDYNGDLSVPPNLGEVTAVAAGSLHSMALKRDGTVAAWGDNSTGETNVPAGLSGVIAIAAGFWQSFAIRSNGTVAAWGDNSCGETTVPSTVSNVQAIAVGNCFTLALTWDGKILAWGDNSYADLSVPALPANVHYTSVAAGVSFALAARSDGKVVAWGDNSNGQTNVPATLANVVQVSAGPHTSVALRSNGTVAAWGWNGQGQANTSSLTGVVAISQGWYHGLALESNGTVTCWGTNVAGQCNVPSPLRGLVGVSAGQTHSLALRYSYPGSTYHPITPRRVLDTRATGGVVTNIGLKNPFYAGAVRSFMVAGARYVGGGSAAAIPANSVAVTGNLTVVSPSSAGLVAVGPAMTPTGNVSSIIFAAGDIRANNMTVGLAVNGALQAVYRAPVGAHVQLIFDVTGYFTADTTGGTYFPLTPGRVLDTRPTSGTIVHIGLAGKFKTGVVRSFNVAGVVGLGWISADVPSNAVAVTGNVTVTNATSNGYVSVGPTMVSVPKTSTVNTVKGRNRANGVTVSLNAGKLQAVWVGTSGSSADVIFDVTGYFLANQTGYTYHPIVPYHIADTVAGVGLSSFLVSGTPVSLTVAGVNLIAPAAKGISGNLTLLKPNSPGFAFISPISTPNPGSSTVNAITNEQVANGLDVALGGGGVVYIVWIGHPATKTNLQLDVTGYWM